MFFVLCTHDVKGKNRGEEVSNNCEQEENATREVRQPSSDGKADLSDETFRFFIYR